ncbi:MFS transporter [Amylocarpus encephaloides]|uniref:MFS transporter n=1 Tax=Amylocarpus encephaloides TaxID=45428 RepID=A0A9P7YCI3_9HELO|nr:MFS transporter [Amylocarpus encephaloides]
MAVANDGVAEGESLGRVQLRSESGEIILVPKPSSNPNDPLNWSQGFKYYVAIITCFGMLMCTFLAAGPTVALVEIAMDFGGGPTADLATAIPLVAFFFTVSALTQGLGNLLWQPLINKYGKRPIYILSFSGYFATAIWSGASTSYDSELAARVLLGFFSGAGECLGPGTISDVFFLHERATAMSMYNFATGSGVSLGIIASGIITLNNSWRVIYWVGTILIGILLLLIIFTLPETAYNRNYDDEKDKDDIYENKKNPFRLSISIILDDDEKAQMTRYYEQSENKFGDAINEQTVLQEMDERVRRLEQAVLGDKRYSNLPRPTVQKKISYAKRLVVTSKERFTNESLWRMFIRPFVLILLPPIIWATLVMSVLIGFNVAISSSFANDFKIAYGFTAFQSGLCFFGAFVGGILGIPAGGPVGEWVANYFTIRNNGIREPEFRLPAIGISVLTAPLSLILYGVGLQYKMHFMVPVLGLSLLSFSGGQAINISFVYILDAYAPVAGEATITQLAFKSLIGFALSAYTNVWIAQQGQMMAFVEMGIITLFVLLLAVPLFVWGARLRRWSLGWRCVRFVDWDRGREGKGD